MGKQKWKVSRIEEESTVESDGLETFEEFPSGKDLILVFHDVCELGVKELEKKAIAGDVKAQFRLGMVYESGSPVIGVHPEGQDSLELYRFDIQDLTEAAKWFQLAADQGDVGSQHLLGGMYENGRGVPEDELEAAKWFQLAADQGYAPAQVCLGLMYADSEAVPEDFTEATKWYRKAADQGDATGQHLLGCMYELGQGVLKDYKEAAKWYRKAADQGYGPAQEHLEDKTFNEMIFEDVQPL